MTDNNLLDPNTIGATPEVEAPAPAAPVDKNAVLILGYTASALNGLKLKQGFNALTFDQLAAAIQPHLVVKPRGEMERSLTERHLIPYLRVTNELGHVFAYQRGKGVGESRLAGNDSIGLGGHIDQPDIVYNDDGSVNLYSTVWDSASRELGEEVSGVFTIPRFTGVIVDDSDEVGQVHLGLVMEALCTSDPAEVACLEPELRSHGFMPMAELGSLRLESWSSILFNDWLVKQPSPQQLEAAEQARQQQLASHPAITNARGEEVSPDVAPQSE